MRKTLHIKFYKYPESSEIFIKRSEILHLYVKIQASRPFHLDMVDWSLKLKKKKKSIKPQKQREPDRQQNTKFGHFWG